MERRLHGGGTDHRDLARTLHALGDVALKKNDLGKAESRFHESLRMKRRLYGEKVDHQDIAVSLHELGNIRSEKGNLENAEKMYQESLDMKETSLR